MAKKKEEELNTLSSDFDLDKDALEESLVEVKNTNTNIQQEDPVRYVKVEDNKEVVNCLRNERVVVRYIPRERNSVKNPKHILYGGMAENATRTFVVPRLSSGMFVNVLTDSEKAFLENVMGLEYNALSVYKKVNNFWDDSNDVGISRVKLKKQDNYLDLSNPDDYIKYKILLANKDYIAPSLQELQDRPKATYQYVIIAEGEESKEAKLNMSNTMMCYKEFGKIENDIDILRTIIETIEGKPTSRTSKLEFLQTRINNLIQADSKMFLRVVQDPLLKTKVLIKKAIENGIISCRGEHLYLTSNNTPLCEYNEEPVLSVAAKYLNTPKHQDILFSIQAKLK